MDDRIWALFSLVATFPFAVAGCWYCWYCWYQALRRRTPAGEAAGSGFWAWRDSLWGPPSHFTPAGHRYRIAAIACMFCPEIVAGVCLLLVLR